MAGDMNKLIQYSISIVHVIKHLSCAFFEKYYKIQAKKPCYFSYFERLNTDSM